jgi:hypothetical protein
VHVLSFANCCDDSTDVLTVLNDGLAGFKVPKRDFMPNRHVLFEITPELTIVLGHDAQHARAGSKIFNDNDANIVAPIMHQKVRCVVHGLLKSVRRVSHKI